MTSRAVSPGLLAAGRARPLDWPVVVLPAVAVALTALLSLALRGHEIPLLLAHLQVLIVVVGAAHLLDDAAAEVTSVVSTSLVQRRLAAAAPALLVVVAAMGVLTWLWSRWSPSLAVDALAWEAVGLVPLVVALGAVLAWCGQPEPGSYAAGALGLGFVGVLLFQAPLHLHVLVTSGDDPVHGAAWACLATGSVAVALVASLRTT